MKTIAFAILSVLILFAISLSFQKSSRHLTIGATSVPHAEILEFIKPEMLKAGYNIDILVIDDYTIQNRALDEGDIDANFFQHLPYLEAQITQFKFDIIPLVKVHIEPMALYSLKYKSMDTLPDGATIAVPQDPSNQARALLLLQKQGLIQLAHDRLDVSIFDIKTNDNKYRFLEIDSPLLARSLEDVDAAAINTNFALQANLSPMTDALAIESLDSPFSNIVAIRTSDAEREDLKYLSTLLTSKELKHYIYERYKGAIMPAE